MCSHGSSQHENMPKGRRYPSCLGVYRHHAEWCRVVFSLHDYMAPVKQLSSVDIESFIYQTDSNLLKFTWLLFMTFHVKKLKHEQFN